MASGDFLFNFDVQPNQFANPNVLLGALGFGPDAPPDCNVLLCDGTVPTQGSAQNLGAVLGSVTGAAGGLPPL